MQKEELKNKILEIIRKNPLGAVATIKEGKPWVRYMIVRADDDLTLFTTSFARSRKVEQINKDGNVHVALGGDVQNWKTPFANIIGTASVLTDAETKKRCWNDMLKAYFSGPDDPDYAVVKIAPQVIEYMSPDLKKPELYSV